MNSIKLWIFKNLFKNQYEYFLKLIAQKDEQINNLKQRINFLLERK